VWCPSDVNRALYSPSTPYSFSNIGYGRNLVNIGLRCSNIGYYYNNNDGNGTRKKSPTPRKPVLS
jgi:hypothetical protein